MKKALIYLWIFSCSLGTSLAAFTLDGITYAPIETETNEVAIIGYTEELPAVVTLPEEVENDGVTYRITQIQENAFSHCANLSSIQLSNSIQWIGECAFCHCENLESVAISESVEKIDNNIFSASTLLTSLEVEGNNSYYQAKDGILYTKDGKELIACINGIDTVSILESVEYIHKAAFENCVNLTSIKIPDQVTALNGYTFSYCISLTEIKLPKSLKQIGDLDFNYCLSLSEIALPDSLTEISYSAFNRCQQLQTITLPAMVKSIGKEAFINCSSLKEVEFLGFTDVSATSIFSGCNSLEAIKCHSTTPAPCNNYTFSDYSIPLYVPEGSIEEYKQAEGWKNFTQLLPLEDVTQTFSPICEVRFTIYTTPGKLHINLSEKLPTEIYRINGDKIYNNTLPMGAHQIDMESGIAVVKIGETYRKVLID